MISLGNIDINKISLGNTEINKGSLGDSEVFSAMLAGDSNYGFFGEVPTSEFITGNALASAIGLTAGTAQNSNEPWLKFALDGKALYVAKKPYRHTISWNSIDSVGAVFGTKTVVINEKTYKVRLLKGGNQNPMPDWLPPGTSVHNSEWNKLMIPIHISWSDGTLAGDQWIDPSTPDWNIRYTNSDLIVGQNPNELTWCQEDIKYGSKVYAVLRGGNGVQGLARAVKTDKSGTDVIFVWRPCLEEV